MPYSENLLPLATFCITKSHSPGMDSAGSMVTRTEVSMCSEPRMTWHTYSPESAGDTWCSLSREPWVCEWGGLGFRQGLKCPQQSPLAGWPQEGFTWCLAGRLPPRLCHDTCACPGAMQFRSKVCPSATWEDEDSMRMGGVLPAAGHREGGWRPSLERLAP